jgi:spore coat polysaccharide biosynthesis protein SpsF
VKSLAIIQARMSSNRLPGKVLMKIENKTLIERTIDAAKLAKNIDKIYVATSNDKSDDILYEYLTKRNISVYRGSLDNVFSRYYKIAHLEKQNYKNIVRLTGDCPLIDPNVIDDVIKEHYQSNNDYTSTGLSKSYPLGQAVEVIKIDTLLNLNNYDLDKEDLEHVTRYIWKRPNKFLCGSKVYINEDFPNCSELRLTVDQIEDFELIKRIIEGLSYTDEKKVSLEEMIEFLYSNEELIEINKNVQQIQV